MNESSPLTNENILIGALVINARLGLGIVVYISGPLIEVVWPTLTEPFVCYWHKEKLAYSAWFFGPVKILSNGTKK
jgi:hypothetical protein